MGGATRCQHTRFHSGEFQSTLPVGGSDSRAISGETEARISIHAPRGGSDAFVLPMPGCSVLFQSTLPVGGATCPMGFCLWYVPYFNPRSPWGERLSVFVRLSWHRAFQSTLPVGGSDSTLRFKIYTSKNFNPRSPWGERPLSAMPTFASANFNPHSPWGERLAKSFSNAFTSMISIHTPRGGSDVRPICPRHIS